MKDIDALRQNQTQVKRQLEPAGHEYKIGKGRNFFLARVGRLLGCHGYSGRWVGFERDLNAGPHFTRAKPGFALQQPVTCPIITLCKA